MLSLVMPLSISFVNRLEEFASFMLEDMKVILSLHSSCPFADCSPLADKSLQPLLGQGPPLRFLRLGPSLRKL